MKRAVVLSTGAYLPERVIANKEFEATLDTSDEWIVERTGIKQRHRAADHEKTSDLAIAAAKQAIAKAGVPADSIDLLIMATNTPDVIMPATAPKVQRALGMRSAPAFDLNAACSGFIYALSMANAQIISGQAKRVMIIGAETFSRILNWQDRGTCILFGDGAAAMIIDAQEGKGTNDDRGILHVNIHSDGEYFGQLGTADETTTERQKDKLFMQGKDIFRHAVAKMPEAVMEGVDALGLTLADIDWLVPHQANQRILAGVGDKLGIDGSKVISAVGIHANTSAASIPLALHVAAEDGRLKPGQLVACPALGAGLTWGSAIVRW